MKAKGMVGGFFLAGEYEFVWDGKTNVDVYKNDKKVDFIAVNATDEEVVAAIKEYSEGRQAMKVEFKAAQFAVKVHEGQKDKKGLPFVNHPIAVAHILEDWGEPDYVVAAGYLHDVIEDTPVDYDHLADVFGAQIAQIVDGVSRRDDETYRQFIDRVAESGRDSIVVKLADMRHNSSPERQIPETKGLLKRYAEATEKLRAVLCSKCMLTEGVECDCGESKKFAD